MLFIHSENQKLLWNAVQRLPSPITNMEELLQRHLEERDKELANTRLIIEDVQIESSLIDEEMTIE